MTYHVHPKMFNEMELVENIFQQAMLEVYAQFSLKAKEIKDNLLEMLEDLHS
jgi:hypothetical protein